jgi:hypothetical protein
MWSELTMVVASGIVTLSKVSLLRYPTFGSDVLRKSLDLGLSDDASKMAPLSVLLSLLEASS